MNDHLVGVSLSAYLDGALSAKETDCVEEHLSSCAICRQELRSLTGVKKILSAAPRRAMPADLSRQLERRLAKPVWKRPFLFRWSLPPLRMAVEIAAIAAVVMGLWIGGKHWTSEETLPLELLLAAHSRYAAEGLVAPGDMVASNFSSELAVYYDE